MKAEVEAAVWMAMVMSCNSGRAVAMVVSCNSGRAVAMVVVIAAVAVAMADAAAAAATTTHVVGGASQWTFGFNYTAWADATAPFYTGDSLVFQYTPKVFMNITVSHNVYLFQDFAHFQACNFAGATLLARESQGNPGFKYQLTNRGWYYFGCSIKNGVHCNEGLMKFRVKAMHHHHML